MGPFLVVVVLLLAGLGAGLACAPGSGPTADRLALWQGEAPGEQLGISLAFTGDLDGDGLADVALGAGQGGRAGGTPGSIQIVAQSGQTLRALHGSQGLDGFGLALASAGDANGDGRADLLVGIPRHDEGGQDRGEVLLLSGADGSTLVAVAGAAAGDAFGVAVAGPGDLDGDGVPDLAASALQPALGPDRDPGPGAVRAHSGVDGHPLFSASGGAGRDDYGRSLAAPGDLDGDGVPDLAVGAPGAQAVAILSGRDGRSLRTQSSIHGGFGASLVAAGDVDLDGVVDLAVGAPEASARVPLGGGVVLLSGRDGRELVALHGERGHERLGAALAGLGDLDGDGRPELAIGGTGSTRVRIVALPSGRDLADVPAGPGQDRFGVSLAGRGDLLLVGFPGTGADGALPGGAALYRVRGR